MHQRWFWHIWVNTSHLCIVTWPKNELLEMAGFVCLFVCFKNETARFTTLECNYRIPVTTRIITFFVRDPNLNLHLPLLLWGGHIQIIVVYYLFVFLPTTLHWWNKYKAWSPDGPHPSWHKSSSWINHAARQSGRFSLAKMFPFDYNVSAIILWNLFMNILWHINMYMYM